jgi:hypothetical protein
MRFLTHVILLCLMPIAGWAQSSLPPCPKDVKAYWHNCFGTIAFPGGNRYEGEYKNNQRNGRGTFTFANGDKYVGQLMDDKLSGQGVLTFANGNKYVGEYKDDNFNGHGTFTFANGNKYVGEYKEGKREGQGTFTFASGDKYVGEFKGNKRDGQGTYTFANGGRHVGEWRDDSPNGQGIEYRADGTIVNSGQWTDGRLAKSYALDRNRFPFGGATQIATPGVDTGRAETKGSAPVAGGHSGTNRIPDYLVPAQSGWVAMNGPATAVGGHSGTNRIPDYPMPAEPGRAERDRLAAEAEAARRMQRELEQRLFAQQEEARRQQQLFQERLAQEARERERLVAEARGSDRLQAPRPAAQRQERRVALVVGNAAYKNQPLANPVNDATDVAATLRTMGFETTLLRDATLAQMRNATRQFADAAASSDVALIFFAGHGIEAKGRNYVIPVGAEIKHEYELEDQAYDASRWLDMLEGIKTGNRQRVNIVILDACRNNELVRSWRSSSRGLARMDAPTGTFVAFATAPGKVAGDGANGQRNSPFTKSLLRAIQSPDVPIELVFKEVRRMVIEETNNDQVPWDNSSLVGDFVFRRTR